MKKSHPKEGLTADRGAVDQNNVNENVEDFLSNWNRLLSDAASKSGDVCGRMFASWNKELSEFARRRFEHNTQTLQNLTECKSWTDVLRVQQNWLSEAAQSYLDESSRISELCHDMVMSNANLATSEMKSQSDFIERSMDIATDATRRAA